MAEKKATAKKTRARNDKGHYVADDPSTPDVNEAFVEEKKSDFVKSTKFKGVTLNFTEQGNILTEEKCLLKT